MACSLGALKVGEIKCTTAVFVTIFFTTVLLTLAAIWARSTTNGLRGVPYLRGYPIIGSIPTLFNLGLPHFIQHLIAAGEKDGMSYCHLGPSTLVALRDPALVRQVLSQPDEILDRQGPHKLWTPLSGLRRIVGDFLFFYTGEKARVGRKWFRSELNSPRVLESKFDFFVGMAAKHVERMATDSSGDTVPDLRRIVHEFAMDMWGELIFDMSDAHKDAEQLLRMDDTVNHLIVDPAHTFWHGVRSIFTLKAISEPDYVERATHQEIDNILQARLQHVQDLEKPRHGTLRNLSIKTGGPPSGPLNDFAVDLARFNLYGGHHTFGLVIPWLLFELNRNPAAYAKVKKEIRDLAASEKGLTFLAVQRQMPFLDAAINETLRLYPVVHATARVVNRNFDLQTPKAAYTPVTLTRGTVVYVSFYHLHHDAEFWGPDVEAFRPERFLGTDGHLKSAKDLADHFMPYGSGTRNCVGFGLAALAVKAFLVVLLLRFDVELEDLVQNVEWGAMLQPAKPFRFSVKPVP